MRLYDNRRFQNKTSRNGTSAHDEVLTNIGKYILKQFHKPFIKYEIG